MHFSGKTTGHPENREEAVVKQGDKGDKLYLLADGECKAFIQGDQGELEVKHYKKLGQYFGEVALVMAQCDTVLCICSSIFMSHKL